jgi:uncharacterized phage protein (TIGR01671 family)
MREIKFRYVKQHEETGRIFSVIRTLEDIEESEYHGLARYGHVAVNQFTGLKDKNGREIYEGDILRGRYFHLPLIVTYDESACSFELRDKTGDHAEHLFDTSGEGDLGYNYWEILGNIYEKNCAVDVQGCTILGK